MQQQYARDASSFAAAGAGEEHCLYTKMVYKTVTLGNIMVSHIPKAYQVEVCAHIVDEDNIEKLHVN